MDPVKNPFSPGAGAPPPELVGREAMLEQARVLLVRIKDFVFVMALGTNADNIKNQSDCTE